MGTTLGTRLLTWLRGALVGTDAYGNRYYRLRGDKPADYSIVHVYNRVPWGASEPLTARAVAPGAASAWVGLGLQDTCHFALVRFVSTGVSPASWWSALTINAGDIPGSDW